MAARDEYKQLGVSGLKVTIVSCSNQKFWYSQMIGQELEVLKEAKKLPDGRKGYVPISAKYWAQDKVIDVNDCEIIKEQIVQNSNERQYDSVTKPLHYHKDGLDPITVMKRTFTEEELRGFFRGNILKYSMRYREKGGMADLEKLSDYTRMLMELEGETT